MRGGGWMLRKKDSFASAGFSEGVYGVFSVAGKRISNVDVEDVGKILQDPLFMLRDSEFSCDTIGLEDYRYT